jgi:peptide/nickel transport system permease protein
MRAIREGFEQLRRYPSAVIGLIIIALLIILSIYTVIAIPYPEAIRLWRGGEEIWQEHPRNASPSWVNLFLGKNLPTTIVIETQEGRNKTIRPPSDGLREVEIKLAFDYGYDDFPSELTLFFEARYEERRPYVSLFWRTPDGREIPLGEQGIEAAERYPISQDRRLQRRLAGLPSEMGLFADPAKEELVPLKGRYELVIEGLLFEESSDLDAKLIVYGRVHGLAGTDHRRRDLLIGILWGAPIALAFGILAAFGSTILTFIIAAIGVWYGRWLDAAIQRLTEINLILPPLVILIMVGTFYSRSIWVMLGVVILLGIFSAGIKTYRAIFIQVKESPYIEAAKAYGAGNLRIVFRYMLPRMIPTLIPSFVILVPALIFLEASLAVLGLGDPILPTWGKLINEARANGALYQGYYYWILQPSALLLLTGLGFAMVGFALDRIFNPRLRVE